MTEETNRPLEGLTVLITRARSQAGRLADALGEIGARVISVPVIAFAPPSDPTILDGAIARIDSFAWLVLTSVNGVERFFERLGEATGRTDLPEGLRVAAIGPVTALALATRGVTADVVPERYIAEDLAASLPVADLAGRRVLIARAELARDVLPDTLRAAGVEVVVAPCYKTVRPDVDAPDLARRLGSGEIDFITFTSSSTVTNFAGLFSEGEAARLLLGVTVACIGPITAKTARELGIAPEVEAGAYTIDGLVGALVRHVTGPGARP